MVAKSRWIVLDTVLAVLALLMVASVRTVAVMY
jgi:hypothetical protein